jgi:PAS domain S-box-containing protein
MTPQDIDSPEFSGRVPSRMKEVISKGYSFLETVHVTRDGKHIPIELSARLFDFMGRQAIISVARDITNRKNTEKILRENEEKYSNLFHHSNDSIFIHDLEGRIIDVNRKTLELFGYERQDILSLNIQHLNPPEVLEKSRAAFESIVRNGFVSFEIAFRKKNGEVFPAEVSSSLFEIGGEKVIQGIVRDVTEKKRSEERLRESEELYRTLAYTSPDGVTTTDLNGNITYASKRTLELHGFEKPGEMIGKSAFDLFAPEDHDRARENTIITMQKGVVRDAVYTLLRKDGSRFIGELNAALIRDARGRPKAFIATTRDITERKREEQRLRESEVKYRTLVEQSLQGVLIIQGYRVVFANPAMVEIIGYSVEELPTFSAEEIQSLIHPDDREFVWTRFKQRLEGKPVPQRYELRAMHKDGNFRWLEIFSTAIEFLEKPAIQATFIDITDRKQMESAIRESEEKFRTLAEQSPNMIFINKKGAVVYVNDRCSEIMGYTKDEFYSPDFDYTILIAPEYGDLMRSNFERHMKGEDVGPIDYALVTKGERRLDGILTSKLIAYQGETAILGIITDITERKMLEERLRQAQKMEAVGTLAGGIAHDFNNILVGITGYSDLLLAQLDEDSQARNDVLEIKKSADRAASLTKQLLAFGRRQMLQMKAINLNEVVTRMENMLVRLTEEDIELITRLESGLRSVKADKHQMELAIINLAINARDAMPGGGKLTISTENVLFDEESCKSVPDARPGEFVCLSVSDTGIGMDEGTKERVFEPFFSTKEFGKGTGLGLATVYGSIKQHNGWINVYSEPGAGSAYKIFLPVSEKESETVEEKTEPLAKLRGKGDRILLVEDDESVRKFTARVLRKHGYTVKEAVSAEEGLDIFEREKGEFDLVFSDVVLPGRTGLQLAEDLLPRKPELRVILTSGYTEQKSQWRLIQEKGFHFIQKPYSINDLLVMVRDAIRAR